MFEFERSIDKFRSLRHRGRRKTIIVKILAAVPLYLYVRTRFFWDVPYVMSFPAKGK